MNWERIGDDWFWDAPPGNVIKRLHAVPLPKLAQRILSPRQDEGRVFPHSIDTEAVTKRVRELTGLDDWIYHACRHLAETKMAELRIPPHIRDLLADSIRVGLVTTLTTPAKCVGEDLRDGFLLGLDQIGRRVGDVGIEAVIADDAFSPDVGLAATKKLTEEDKVDILAGYVWSNILIPSSEFALAANKIVISANAGPSLRAGEGCHPNFFNISFQNGQLPAAIAKFFSDRGGTKAYVMVPDYAAGLDMANGFKSAFTGDIVGLSLTRWNPIPDTDFEPIFGKARAAGADLVFAFYPGRPGFEFLRQYKTSGLVGNIALATSFTVDAISLRSLGENDVGGVWGMLTAVHWAPNLAFDQNKRFVATFQKQFGRVPSFYAAQSYDLVFLLKAALERTKGAFRDNAAFRDALRAVQWPSTRGPIKFGRNHFLRQNLYLATVVAENNDWALRALDVIERDATDAYASECSMPE